MVGCSRRTHVSSQGEFSRRKIGILDWASAIANCCWHSLCANWMAEEQWGMVKTMALCNGLPVLSQSKQVSRCTVSPMAATSGMPQTPVRLLTVSIAQRCKALPNFHRVML